ncbi:MAG: amino acid permease [Deltaproteobacteria bacterium]|nr:amino acid permease [Deltaproteobacteria bacterium]
MTARKLGFTAAAAIVVANMIGTGVFTSTGFQAASLHDPLTILIAWVVGGVLALSGAVAYAELGAMMPRVGDEYVYLREAYHPVVGVMSGWASLVAGFSAPIAAAAMAFAKYTAVIAPGLAGGDTQKIVAIALILAFTALHSIDVILGGRVQTWFTAAKTILIVVFIGAGLLVGSGDWGHFATHGGGTANIWSNDFAISLMYVSFAYSGWNAAAYIAGEIEQPERNVPRALILGTGAVMALYVLLNVVFLYALGPVALGEGPNGPIVEVGASAAIGMFGQSAGTLLSTLIALALVSAVSAMVMAGPRVYAAMAEDRALPKILARRSKGGAPLVSVMLQSTIAIAIVILGKFDEVVRYVGFTLAIFAALTVAGVIVMRFKRPDAARPYRTFLYPLTPILFVAMSCWVAYAQIKEHPTESLYVLATLVLGAGAYFAAGLHKGEPRAE